MSTLSPRALALRNRCAGLALRPEDWEVVAQAVEGMIPAWQSIETAPKDHDVILAWWQEWPERKFCQKIGWAGKSNSYAGTTFGVSDAWLDGEATLWQPIPAPPTAAETIEETGA